MMSVVSAKPNCSKALPDGGKIIVGIADRRHRGRPVDAGLERQEAVALIVLGAIRITRPEDDDERLSVVLEFRQHDFRQSVGEISLLFDVGDLRSGHVCVARLAVARRAKAIRAEVLLPAIPR